MRKPITKNFFLLLILAAFFFRLYKLDLIFPFDWDQQISAYAAYDFFKYHKIGLIGQEMSFPGYFSGPLINWMEFLPYGICSLKPDCVPYFFMSMAIVSLILLYFVISKIYGVKIALITLLIFSFSFSQLTLERISNANFVLFPTTIVMFFCLYKYFKNKNIFLPLGAFFAGLAVVNFNPVYIFSTAAYFFASLFRKKISTKWLLISTFAFLINWLPLAIFNFRHENIILGNLRIFLETNAYVPADGKLIYVGRNILLPYYTDFLFTNTNLIFSLFTLALILIGIKLSKNEKNPLNIYLVASILITYIGFVFYRSRISDYYFLQLLLPLAILSAKVLGKSKWLFLVFLAMFLFTNLSKAKAYSSTINYKIKKAAVSHIISDTKEKDFKLYIDMPYGLNTGYAYLFKAFGKEPTKDGENIYFLLVKPPESLEMERYYKVFPDKKIDLKTFGYVEVISVK